MLWFSCCFLLDLDVYKRQLVQRADFPVVRVGHRLLVSTEGLREWVKKEAGVTES